MATHDHAAVLWAGAQMMLMLMFFCVFVFAQYSAVHSNAAAHCIASERIILLQFKATLNDGRQFKVTYGLDFKKTWNVTGKALPSWNESNPNCCTWEGVSCDKDNNNHVVALSLGGYGLLRNNSVAPSEVLATISKLHMLQSLDLSFNFQEDSSSGISIPPEVGALRNLLFLNLSEIYLSSKVIPMHIGNLSSLKTLDLSYAGYQVSSSPGERAILATEALLSLSKLEDLRLDGVSLQYRGNWANSICKLHNIKTLSMNLIDVNEALPACLVNLTYLTFLSLDYSDFTSYSPLFNIFANLTSLVYLSAKSPITPHTRNPIPASMNFPPSLSYLDLSRNNFSGNPLRSLCSLTSLKYLDLSTNAFEGTIPSCICSLASLKYLDLSTNAFEGTIPSCIGNLTKLNNMRLYDNRFEGFIPPTIRNLTRLNTLLLHNNHLQGSIPSSISLLTRLKTMDLSSNLLTGTFSLSLLKNCTALTRLSLSHNSLTVVPSQTWSSLMQLEILGLNSCSMKGQFPSFVRHHPSLEDLALSGNNLVGSIPSWVWKFKYLRELDLSFNNFTGTLPSDITNLSSLEVLNLQKNKFYGLLPSSFPDQIWEILLSHNLFNGSLSSFNGTYFYPIISLAYNNISGMVPWVEMMKLNPTELDLSQNNLHGQLTLEKLSNDCSLLVLNLNGNHFSGAIPNLLKCSGLWIMDIGNNKMHGSVPKWIGKLKDLKIVILRSNNFHGKIPQELLMLKDLQILDVSSNKLSGFLPAGFGSLTTMAFQGNSEYWNSVGRFSIDEDLSYLVNVTSGLKMDNKGIYYDYSENVVSLMRCIDVSNNRFTGEIPDEIGLLKGLIILNMSYNQLSGNIPKSLAQISQLDCLDLSNNFLSGEIPADLVRLSMLGVLNLSHNQLTGRIPDEPHFETYPASSFGDNPGLCGFQINKSCSDEKKPNSLGVKAMHSKDLHYLLYWLACGLGFGFGFAIVMILLSFHAVRTRCFAVIDSIIYSTHFFILVILVKMKCLS